MLSNLTIKTLSLIIIGLLLQDNSNAQRLAFNRLNTSNGLSDNNVRCISVDRNGLLWIGTTDGLNVYDGYTIKTWKKEDNPELPSDNLTALLTDPSNNLWIASPEGVAIMDGKRRFKRIKLQDTISRFSCTAILPTKTYGVILFTQLGQFFNKNGSWQKLDWMPELLSRPRKILHISAFSEDRLIFSLDSTAVIFDYASRKIVYQDDFFPMLSACRTGENEIAVGLQTGRVSVINITTKKILREYKLAVTLNNNTINTNLTDIDCAPNGDLVVTTGFAGLVVISPAGKLSNYTHDPLDLKSISANNTSRVLTQANGNIFIGSATGGINICNINNPQPGYTSVFSNTSGELFDSYLNEMVEDPAGNIWIGAYDRLICWNRKTNLSKYFYYTMQTPLQGFRTVEIKALCFDKKGKLWLSAPGGGVAVMDTRTGNITKIDHDTSLGPALRSHYIVDMIAAADGKIWACTNTGIFRIDPNTNAVSTFDNDSLLKRLGSVRTSSIFEDSRHNIWVAAFNSAVVCYKPSERKLIYYTTKEGLTSNQCISFREDRNGNIYIGGPLGFNIIKPDGKIESYGRKEGLRYDRCEGFLEDSSGNMWIANNKCLVKFNPADKSMKYFDDNAGINSFGFRYDACLKTNSGEMLWAGQKGINYFYPTELVNKPAHISLTIYEAIFGDSTVNFSSNASFDLPYNKNSIQLHFAAINLSGSKKIRYQYRLEGYDKNWQSGTDLNEARYSSLPPGKYSFKVKASLDGIHWIESNNEVAIKIIPPLWQRWWFICLMLALLFATIYFIVRIRNKKRRLQKEEADTQQAINYFASTMYQQQSVDAILWDVVKNCIGRMQFEHCVIYLLDEEKNLLVQKAAHGSKYLSGDAVFQPISIPIGNGITGSVALNKKAEIVNDTSRDARYIIDDKKRLSDIAVPILSDGKLLGVIDCEHSEKNFFTPKHLATLTTIASLCANKITRARAEQEKLQLQIKTSNFEKEKSIMQYQHLKNQVNPHFLFNTFTSLDGLIQTNPDLASDFVRQLSKVYRYVLEHKENEVVSLQTETDFIRHYISLLEIRYRNVLNINMNISAAAMEKGIVTVTLQMLIDNAIKHNSLQVESPLSIQIWDNAGYLHVSNNKQLRKQISTSNKQGLQQLKDLYAFLSTKAVTINDSKDFFEINLPLL